MFERMHIGRKSVFDGFLFFSTTSARSLNFWILLSIISIPWQANEFWDLLLIV